MVSRRFLRSVNFVVRSLGDFVSLGTMQPKKAPFLVFFN